jgi:hypothetical protein
VTQQPAAASLALDQIPPKVIQTVRGFYK